MKMAEFKNGEDNQDKQEFRKKEIFQTGKFTMYELVGIKKRDLISKRPKRNRSFAKKGTYKKGTIQNLNLGIFLCKGADQFLNEILFLFCKAPFG